MQRHELAERAQKAGAIATAAAALAAQLRAQGGGVASLKGAQDFVTEADRATERFIRAELHTHFPNEAILGEEMGGAADGTGPLWVLDPIDGTSNFARGGIAGASPSASCWATARWPAPSRATRPPSFSSARRGAAPR
jgi:myo-inositol-1(or 4)-monophosphatase